MLQGANVTREQTATAWREIESATRTADWLLKWADCNGPLAHLPTSDPAVRAAMNARRHLLRKAHSLRKAVVTQ